MIDRLIATAGLILIAGRTMQRCRQLNTRDDRRRPAITAEAGLRVVYEAAVAAAIVSAFFAFWTDLPVLLKTHDSATLRLVGTVLSVVGLMGFEWACRALAHNTVAASSLACSRTVHPQDRFACSRIRCTSAAF